MDLAVIAPIIGAIIGAVATIMAAIINVRDNRRSTSVDSESADTSQQDRAETPNTSGIGERAVGEAGSDTPPLNVERREAEVPPSTARQTGPHAPTERAVGRQDDGFADQIEHASLPRYASEEEISRRLQELY